jgi:hypothetical protein
VNIGLQINGSEAASQKNVEGRSVFGNRFPDNFKSVK